MVNKNKLEPKQFYELRLQNQIDTPFGHADHVFSDKNLDQWLANRILKGFHNTPYKGGNDIYRYDVLRNDKGEMIQAPEDWDGGMQIIKARDVY